MKTSSVLILVIMGCLGAWTYQANPKGWNDFFAANFGKADAPVTITEQKETPTPSIQTNSSLIQPAVAEQATPVEHLVTVTQPSPVTPTVSVAPAIDETKTQKTFIPPNPFPEKPDWVWTTTDGQTFKGVKITKVEADCVTILDDDGGALVPISKLPSEIQKLLNYDPGLGAAAAAQRSAADADAQAELAKEKQKIIDDQVKLVSGAGAGGSPGSAAPKVDYQAMRDEIAIIQAKMVDLQSDIDAKQKEIDRNSSDEINGDISSQNSFREIINSEGQQLQQLAQERDRIQMMLKQAPVQ